MAWWFPTGCALWPAANMERSTSSAVVLGGWGFSLRRWCRGGGSAVEGGVRSILGRDEEGLGMRRDLG